MWKENVELTIFPHTHTFAVGSNFEWLRSNKCSNVSKSVSQGPRVEGVFFKQVFSYKFRKKGESVNPIFPMLFPYVSHVFSICLPCFLWFHYQIIIISPLSTLPTCPNVSLRSEVPHLTARHRRGGHRHRHRLPGHEVRHRGARGAAAGLPILVDHWLGYGDFPYWIIGFSYIYLGL